MRRLLATLADAAPVAVLTTIWFLGRGWRTLPRHDERRCDDCQHGRTHDLTTVCW